MEAIPSKDKPIVISAENYKKRTVFKNSILNPKILGSLVGVFLLVVGVGAGVYLTQQPPQSQTQANLATTKISFKPAAIDSKVGEKFSIDVFGDANGNQITSAKIGVNYDPEIMQLTAITPKEFLPKVVIPPSIASSSATISLGSDGNAGISGSGILATLSFTSKKSGSSTVSIDTSQTLINVLDNTSSTLLPVESVTITVKESAITPIPSPSSQASASASASPSARPTTTPAPSTTAGPSSASFDFNSDSQVNSIDLSVIYSAWGNQLDTELKKRADLNSDGVVNGLDYSLFLPNFKP